MGNEGIMTLVIGTVVVYFVPALVWATAIARLMQIIQDKVETQPIQTKLAWEAQQPIDPVQTQKRLA
jgi:hypothetical protein